MAEGRSLCPLRAAHKANKLCIFKPNVAPATAAFAVAVAAVVNVDVALEPHLAKSGDSCHPVGSVGYLPGRV